MTKIPWTNETWNLVTGCTKIAEGCKNCYAETMAKKFWGKRKFTDVRFHANKLEIPLRWGKSRKIFVCSMSDLFHEKVSFEFIDKVMAVIALCPQHTFQILTKRPERTLEYIEYLGNEYRSYPNQFYDFVYYTKWNIKRLQKLENKVEKFDKIYNELKSIAYPSWPLPNLWLGVSVGTQADAVKNIPILLQVSAAVRFVSIEPCLEQIDLHHIFLKSIENTDIMFDALSKKGGISYKVNCGLDWVIIGSESGPKRRPCKIEWIRDIVNQCRVANVPVFVKQVPINLRCSRNPAEWPKDLRVQEYPVINHR
jgi:protein gp37